MKHPIYRILQCITLSILLFSQASAQNWAWSKQEYDPFGSYLSNSDWLYNVMKEKIAVDQFGNTTTCTLFRTVKITGSEDTTRVRINKIDRYGKLIWQRLLTGVKFYDMKIDRFGNTYAALSNFQVFNHSLSPMVSTERCFIKIDSNGKLIWKKPLGGLDYDVSADGYLTLAINSANDNIYAVAKSTLATFSFCDSVYNYPIDNTRYTLFRLDTAGQIKYSRQITGVDLPAWGKLCLDVNKNDVLLLNFHFATGQTSVVWSDTTIAGNQMKGIVGWFNGLNGNRIRVKTYTQLSGNYRWIDVAHGQQMQNGESIFWVSATKVSDTSSSFSFEFADSTITTQLPARYSNPFCLVLDSIGKLKYFKSLGYGKSFVYGATNDGVNYYVAGNKSISVDSAVFLKPYIQKIGANGQILWTSAPKTTSISSYVNDINWNKDILTSTTSLQYTDFPIFGNDTIQLPYTSDRYSVISKVGGLFNIIKGQVYYDLNKNGIRDSIDYGLPNVLISDSANNIYETTGYDGKYSIITDTGSFNLSIHQRPRYTNWNPDVNVVSFSNTYGQVVGQKDFRLTFDTIVRDMSIYSTGANAFRPGRETSIVIVYRNNGNQEQSGKYSIKLHPALQIVSVDSTTEYSSSDSLSWNYINIKPFETRRSMVRVSVNSSIPLNQIIKNTSYIFPIDIDSVPVNNIDTFVDYVRSSYDPNDKLSNPLNEIGFEKASTGNQYIDFTIRFQNTGNDTAFNVYILDSISSKINLNSFEFLASSHSVEIAFLKNRRVEFHFPNILLPDSNRNESLSHGFIRFKAKVNNIISLADTVTNKAEIYFDYNNPVATNMTRNYFKSNLPTAINYLQINSGIIRVFPNPAQDEFFYELLNVPIGKYVIRIYDLKGNLVYITNVFQYGINLRGKISMGYLRKGAYIIEVSGRQNRISQKILKM